MYSNTQRTSISIKSKLVITLLLFICSYVAILLLERQNLIARAQFVDGGSGNRYMAKYGDPKSYRCGGTTGSEIVEEFLDGTRNTIVDCATVGTGQTCYALNNQVRQEYIAACLYNPPAGTGGSGDIAQCKFYRGDQNPVALPFQSSKLISYFQEAAQKSGVPASVLAGIARVETPGSVNFTDQELSAYELPVPTKEFAVSGDGAMGLMQIVAHDKTIDPRVNLNAVCRECIALGASLLPNPKSVNLLTRQDYNDPKTSIYLAAGFALYKMQFRLPEDTGSWQLGNGRDWNPAWTNDKDAIEAVVRRFYGCLGYGPGGCSGGPYSYGQDVWNSVSNCKGEALGEQVPPEQVLTRYQITLQGFSATEEQAIKQKLSDVSGTRLLSLVAGTTIQKSNDEKSLAPGCNGANYPKGYILLAEPTNPLTLIHELGHMVQRCNSSTQSLYQPAFEEIHNEEKGVSDYARNVGTNLGQCKAYNDAELSQLVEDYAETITYYLNPNASDQGLCGQRNSNPFVQKNSDGTLKYAKHLEIVKRIIGPYPYNQSPQI